MFCKRCGSPLAQGERCKPRCMSGNAYQGLTSFCRYCGSQKCKCNQMLYHPASNTWQGIAGTQVVIITNALHREFPDSKPHAWLQLVNHTSIRVESLSRSEAA